jgi:hypothetical protein
MGILMDIFKKRRISEDQTNPDLNEDDYDPAFNKAVQDRLRNSRRRVSEVE